MTVSVKSEPREDGREQRDRKPRGIDSGQITPWAPSPWCGSKRPDITPLLNRLLTEQERKIKSPLKVKARLGAGLRPSRKILISREGRGFCFFVVVYDNIATKEGRLNAVNLRSEYGGFRHCLNLLKNAPMLTHEAFSFAGFVMSGFCIFRAEKHNTVGAVSAALSHDLRERQTPNADPKLYNKNTYSSSDIDAVLTEMKRLVDSCDEKCKNDKPVLCIQYLVTASPEAADDPAFSFDKYLNDGLEALKQKHGAENVIFSAVHRDETTPHMTVYVVPIVDEPIKKVKRSVFTGKKDKDGKAIREIREFDSKPKRKIGRAHV